MKGINKGFRYYLARYFWPRKNWWGARQAAASDWAIYSFIAVAIVWSIINGEVLSKGPVHDINDTEWNGLLFAWGGFIVSYALTWLYFWKWPLEWDEMDGEMMLIYVRYNGTNDLTIKQLREYRQALDIKFNELLKEAYNEDL